MRGLTPLLLVVVAASCTSITVKRVKSKNDYETAGYRYSLPVPILQVVPDGDGSVEVTVDFLPDEDRTYAIEASSCWSAHSMTVETQGGLLSRIAWSGDATGIARDTVLATGQVSSSIIAARAAAEKDHAATVETARGGLDEAKLAAAKARERLRILEETGGTEEETRTAKIAIAEADAEVESKRAALRRARSAPLNPAPAAPALAAATTTPAAAGFSDGEYGTRAATTIRGGPDAKRVHGPVLLRIEEDGNGGVQLIPIPVDRADQPQFKTAAPPSPRPVLLPAGVRAIRPDADGRMILQYTSRIPVRDLRNGLATLDRFDDGQWKTLGPIPVALKASDQVEIDVSGFPLGSFRLTIPYSYRDGNGEKKEDRWLVRFDVVAGPPPGPPALSPRGIALAGSDPAQGGRLTYTLSRPADGILSDRVRCSTSTKEAVPPPPVLLGSNGTQLTVETTGLPPGEYLLVVPFRYRSARHGVRSEEWNIRFRTTPRPPKDAPTPPDLPVKGTIAISKSKDKGITKLGLTGPVLEILAPDVKCTPAGPGAVEGDRPAVALKLPDELWIDVRPMTDGEYEVVIPFRYRDVNGEEAESEWKISVLVFP